MAGNRGVTVFVLLLSCWHEAKLQPINMTSVTRRPPSRTFCDTRCVVPGGLVPRPTRPTVHVNLSLLSPPCSQVTCQRPGSGPQGGWTSAPAAAPASLPPTPAPPASPDGDPGAIGSPRLGRPAKGRL
ncbi:actin cytoskeleton-regulatory complex protein PAN1-like isoform X7 [Canis lupus familiaris]|uniref:actin cytoskeleton-regulatory complex protein PAN1-like isoform X7 n=1 Tax=Canis lupus familiaris TaxID=9615 RepID=UPI0018F76D2D|nr:actin cytoskeleton-regulatory complex protein PAN1-like isoform X7 [Canis lupus familiaris]